MQGNLLTTVLALIFYLTSGIFGGNSSSPSLSETGNSARAQGANFPRSATVSAKQTSVRDNYQNGTTISTVNQGSRVLILDEKADWYQVQVNGDRQGWLPKWSVSLYRNPSGSIAGQKVIAGYYVENYNNDPVGYRALSENLGAINMIIPFSFQINGYGSITSTHNPKPLNLARSAGANTLALINNIQGNNFNSNSIHRMLSTPAARSRAVHGISRILVEKGYQGVNIDFENIPARDRYYLTSFFSELAAELRPRNLLVTASVPAKTYDDRSSNQAGAYDYRALAPYLDQMMIMTYDEHYSGGTAGPVASYPWVEKVINYALRYVPNNKIVVGIAAYGYDWKWGSGKALHYNGIQNLIRKYKVIPKWHPVYRVPYFSYRSWGTTHEVWYENSASTATKVQLVRKYNLRGVAVWRLGYEDPNIWSTIQRQIM
ncbi:MAG TPA: glycoside hydrolase family 18 [Firmicutes bacterium]|jgi:spore germination protein|nr:glycoside hydrolase family 18 [Bacillota bacterium]